MERLTGMGSTADEIPLAVPELHGNEWSYVKECLDTNFVSSVGPFVDRFEQMMAETIGTAHAVATVNGTAALHVALLLAGVRPDDEVLVPTLTFIAPANAVRYAGAWPVFVDAEPDHWQMDPIRVERFLSEECIRDETGLRSRHTGRRVSAILPVHVLGHPADMDSICETARQYGLPVVEDASESLGAKYKGRHTGTLGRLGCFSFNGNKILTTGGGGMIVTQDPELARRAKYLTTTAKDDPIEYIHGEVGYNYRLTNVLAALGCAQLEGLDAYVARKREIARRYDAELLGIDGLGRQQTAKWAEPNEWLYTVTVDPEGFGMDSRRLLGFLGERGIQSRPLWQPLHESPAYASVAHRSCGVAERLNRTALSLPCSVGLTERQQDKVLLAIRAAARRSLPSGPLASQHDLTRARPPQ